MIEVKTATTELVKEWYNGPPTYSMKGYVVLDGEEIIAICGIFYCKGRKYIFSEVKEQMLKHKKTIIRLARKVMAEAEGQTVYAIATSGVESARGFIEHYGFELIDPANNLYRR